MNEIQTQNKTHNHKNRKKRKWRYALAPIIALSALVWLIFRSGSKPSRITYPCQQAALSTASLALGAPFIMYIIACFRTILTKLLTPVRIATALLVLSGILLIQSDHSQFGRTSMSLPGISNGYSSGYSSHESSLSSEYRATVFHKANCPQDPVGDSFPGLEDLVLMMGIHGLKFYNSVVETQTSGPDGIIASDDTVILKINYQWSQRGGTNTNLLSGLIRLIVDHPDIFTGEIVVCENAQFNSTENFDKLNNNAQDTTFSPHDVVVHFQSLGYTVSHFDWTEVRYTSVGEYSQGDMNDGYVVLPFDIAIMGSPSYPKFQTDYGTYISLRNGIWNQVDETYDKQHLKFINLPVLKSHHAAYGVTACVKNYMGVVTRELSTNSHSAIRYGLLGDVIGKTQPADLNILDCIWINADPYTGPNTTYAGATRKDMLVASQDPVAADIWAAKNILIPAFMENGFSPPWPVPSADPDDPTSNFRVYLDNSMAQIIEAGYQVTNDLASIDVPPGEASDPNGPGAPFVIRKDGDGFFLEWSACPTGGPADAYNLYNVSLDTIHSGFDPICETTLGSGTSAFVPSLADNRGFIVVGRNNAGDGSFGRNSLGRERPYPEESNICP